MEDLIDEGERCAARVLDRVAAWGESGRSDIQQTIASMSWVCVGWLCGRQIMSPRLMSMSSSSRRVTDIGGKASSSGPSNVSICDPAVAPTAGPRLRRPGGNAGGDVAGVAAVVVVLVADCRTIHWTGKRVSRRLRSEASARARGGRAATGPGTRASDRASTTLSPSSAEIGMKVMSWTSSFAAQVVNRS